MMLVMAEKEEVVERYPYLYRLGEFGRNEKLWRVEVLESWLKVALLKP